MQEVQQASEREVSALVKPTRADLVGDQTALYEHAIWAVTMASAKIPFASLSEEELTEKAQQYPLLILPRVAWLDDEEVQAVKRMIHAGGHLLITGDSGSCCGPLGQFSRRNGNALAAVAGVRSGVSLGGRTDYRQSAFLKLTGEHPLTRTPYTIGATTIPLCGEQYAIRATEAAPLAQFVSSDEREEVLSDALTVTETNGGRVVWFLPLVAKHFSCDNSYDL